MSSPNTSISPNLPGHEVAVQPLLLHQQPDVGPVGHLVLEAERVLRILAAQPEGELMPLQVVPAQDGLDDLRRGLVLVDAAGLRELQPCGERFDHGLVAEQVAGALEPAEPGDAAGELAGFGHVVAIDGIAVVDPEGGGLAEIVGALEFQRVRELHRDDVGLAQAVLRR